MRLRRYSRGIAAVVVCLFAWTCGGIFGVANAAVIEARTSKKSRPASAKAQTPEERLQQITEKLTETLKDGKVGPEKKKEGLKAARTAIEADDTEIRKQFAATEKKLKAAKLPPEILQRHYRFVKHYDDNMAELKANMTRLDKAKDKATTEAEMEKIRRHLERVKAPSRHQALDPNNLPHRQPKVKKRAPRMKKEEFERDFAKDKTAYKNRKRIMVASAGSLAGLLSASSINPPTTADLAETIDVQLTPEIRAKAQELGNNPVKIYNWVRNNIEYVPTWGSIQGANMTLLTKQGNAFDTSSLLIALLRASGIHSRYVIGTIELPIDKVMNWAGGFTDSMAALDFMNSGGTPATALTEGGKVIRARMEHVWVEAWIDYMPSRGAKHRQGQGDTWIRLDPSYKQYKYTKGIDIKAEVPFDGQTFLDQIKAGATVNESQGYVTGVNSAFVQQAMQDYQARVQNYIQQKDPNATVGDVLGKKEILKNEATYLLGTLPYRTAVKGGTFAGIPDTLRHKLTFTVQKDAYDDAPLTITRSLPELAGKKITLSYSPASTQDEAVINSFVPKPHADGTPIQPSELPTSLPAYLINVKPELRIEGNVVATGSSVKLGATVDFDMAFYDPTTGISIVKNDVNAGSFNAIGINVSKISQGQLDRLNAAISATRMKLQDPNIAELAKEEYIGDFLYATAISYHGMLELSKYATAKTIGVNYVTLPSGNIVSFPLKVLTSWGIPISVSQSGINVDADRLLSIVKALDGDIKKTKEFMITSGMQSSALEHSIPEAMFSTDTKRVEGVSAVKALKIANDAEMPIFTINKDNIDKIMPLLTVDSEVKEDINNAVATGNIVTISQSNINHNGWVGCGYIITNPDTGAGAYMISGRLAGSFTELNAYFTAIVDVIAKQNVGNWVNVNVSTWLKIGAGLGKFFTVVGFAFSVTDIVVNPKLNELQKALEILTTLLATISMLMLGAWIGGVFTLLPALLLAIVVNLMITMIQLLIFKMIENYVGYEIEYIINESKSKEILV